MTALLSPLLEQLATKFRQVSRYDYCFPYNIERAILHSFPISIVKLSKPSVQDIQEWLKARGLTIVPIGTPDRPLFGCTVIYRNRGFFFVDGLLDEAEQRFTLAHELAHYLRDYDYLRELAIQKLGPKILEVLDDERVPEDDERVFAILEGVRLNVYTHLMERGNDGSMVDDITNQAEADADYLALELIAPYESVLQYADVKPHTLERKLLGERLRPVLIYTFDLPNSIANQYATRLANFFGRRPSVKEWLGI